MTQLTRDELLSEALKPFADLCDYTLRGHQDSRPIIHGVDHHILEQLTVGDLRRAKAALETVNAQQTVLPTDHKLNERDHEYAKDVLDDLVHPYEETDKAIDTLTMWARKIRVETYLNAPVQDAERRAMALRGALDSILSLQDRSFTNPDILFGRALDIARNALSPLTSGKPPDGLIDKVLADVAELPDRTSPDDWPDAMLVTADELRTILRTAFDCQEASEG